MYNKSDGTSYNSSLDAFAPSAPDAKTTTESPSDQSASVLVQVDTSSQTAQKPASSLPSPATYTAAAPGNFAPKADGAALEYIGAWIPAGPIPGYLTSDAFETLVDFAIALESEPGARRTLRKGPGWRHRPWEPYTPQQDT